MKKRLPHTAGLSLIEVIISVAILALLLVLAALFIQLQLSRSRDARRKADLEKIRIAFEEYYNDHGCYPDPIILNNCGGPELQPYLSFIPCDPRTNEPYLYVPLGDICRGYRVLAELEDGNDPGIAALNCGGPAACGYGTPHNYGISSGTPVKNDGSYTPPASPTPTPSPGVSPSPSSSPAPSPSGSPGPGQDLFACDPGGECNAYADPQASGCPAWFADPNCQNQCGNPANWCVN